MWAPLPLPGEVEGTGAPPRRSASPPGRSSMVSGMRLWANLRIDTRQVWWYLRQRSVAPSRVLAIGDPCEDAALQTPWPRTRQAQGLQVKKRHGGALAALRLRSDGYMVLWPPVFFHRWGLKMFQSQDG